MDAMNSLKILGGLAIKGIVVELLSSSTFSVSGFYKSGTVIVDIENDTITARYNEKTKIESLSNLYDELISLNYSWWLRSKDRNDGWKNPDRNWVPLLIEKGYITKKEAVVISYE